MGNFQLKWDQFVDVFIAQGAYEKVLEGLKNTLIIAIAGLIIGIIVGILIATVRVVPKYKRLPRVLNGICSFYVGLFRGTPMVVQLLVCYYVLLPILGIKMSGVEVSVLVFGLNSGAYISEIMRGGIMSVDGGQMEAGRAMGLSFATTMRMIVIPQAIKNIIPTLGNEFIALIKETSVVSFVGASDLYVAFNYIGSNSYEFMVPYLVMAVIYIVLSVALIICNITEIPAAIVTVVKGAFNPSAVTGGAVGTLFIAMQSGVARGIFSNESGLGSAPIAAAAAKTKEPVRQGLVSMTGTFIDTIIICTMTGLSIVITETWNTGLEGVAITTAAFQKGLPFPAQFASFALMLCLVFFAFTTILGWDYYGERCLEYLFNRNMTAVKTYRWLYIICVFFGPYMTVAAVWNIADIFNALMAFPNLIALLALSGVVVKETKDFFKKHKNYE